MSDAEKVSLIEAMLEQIPEETWSEIRDHLNKELPVGSIIDCGSEGRLVRQPDGWVQE